MRGKAARLVLQDHLAGLDERVAAVDLGGRDEEVVDVRVVLRVDALGRELRREEIEGAANGAESEVAKLKDQISSVKTQLDEGRERWQAEKAELEERLKAAAGSSSEALMELHRAHDEAAAQLRESESRWSSERAEMEASGAKAQEEHEAALVALQGKYEGEMERAGEERSASP